MDKASQKYHCLAHGSRQTDGNRQKVTMQRSLFPPPPQTLLEGAIVMMRPLMKTLNLVFYTLVAVILVAALGTGVTGRPFLLSVIRSHSMYPLVTRGDLVLVHSLSPDQAVNIGDVVLFKAENGSLASQGWVIHRIVGGNETDGYITQGDFNDESDQANGGSGPVQRGWIASRALTLGRLPIKIPLLGYVPLWAEQFQKSSYSLPLIGLILAVILAASEFAPQKKKRRSQRASKLEKPLLYVFGGLTLSIVLTASMLATSQNLTLVYEVSDNNKGVIMGSNVGIMMVGEEAERTLVELSNKTFLPIIATCTSKDPQLSFSHDRLYLGMGQETAVNFRVKAITPGKYETKMWVGMFYPFLPASVIYWLAKQSFWLALFVVALIPALPIICYPIWDRNLRRQTARELNKNWRRLRARLPI